MVLRVGILRTDRLPVCWLHLLHFHLTPEFLLTDCVVYYINGLTRRSCAD